MTIKETYKEPLTVIDPNDIDISKIRIDCRRWFQTTYGNTYHSVRITHEGDLIAHEPLQYGYGEQCLQTAYIELWKLGVYKGNAHTKPNGRMSEYPQFLKDVRYNYTIRDGRKRDL